MTRRKPTVELRGCKPELSSKKAPHADCLARKTGSKAMAQHWQ